MRLTAQRGISRTRRNITAFGGLDRSARAGGSRLGAMLNMTSDDAPALMSRPPRGIWAPGSAVDGVTTAGVKAYTDDEIAAAAAVNGKLCFATRKEVRADGMLMYGVQPDGQEHIRTIVPFGRNFFLVPDGLYAEKRPEKGYTAKKAGAEFFSPLAVTVNRVDINGEAVTSEACAELPASPNENDSVVLTSGDEAHEYTCTDGNWVRGRRVYPSFSAELIGEDFRVNDKVILKNVYDYDTKRTYRIIGISDNSVTVDAPYKSGTTKLRMSITRYCPVLDFAVESNNRIWGCRYGKNVFGEFVNEIYACSLGDPLSWDAFDGISSDSYAVSLGCPGGFTGAGVIDGKPVFFKEDRIITVSGTVPQNFRVDAVSGDGVENGAYRSIVNLNEELFYKSPNGINVYDGVSSRCISEVFGAERFTAGAAGAVDGKYRVVLTGRSGTSAQYVYDTRSGMWHIEDNDENARFFVNTDGLLCSVCLMSSTEVDGETVNSYMFYAHDFNATENGYNIFSDNTDGRFGFIAEPDGDFFAETREITSQNGSDAVRSVVIRAEKEKDAVLRVGIVCTDGRYHEIYCTSKDINGVFTVPANTPRCASFKLRFGGRGAVKVLSVGIITEKTSEVNGFGY